MGLFDRNPEYRPLDTSTDIEDVRRSSWRRGMASGLLIGIVLSAVVALSIQYTDITTTGQKHVQVLCGRNAKEAEAAGCIFDVMMDEWLPLSCYDEELNSEFQALKEWDFFADANQSMRLTHQQLSHRYSAYTTIEYHVTHCAFALRKLHRALDSGGLIEVNVAAVEHTTHCANYLWETIQKLEASQRGDGEAFSISELGTPLHPGFPKIIDSKHLLR